VFLSPAGGTADEPASMEEMERRMIVAALEQTGGSVPAASKRLGVSEATIYRKIKHFRIQRTRRP
jgi:transcriptional regulator of acetoin/glycerol metabolism